MKTSQMQLLIGQPQIEITPPLDISTIGHGEAFFQGLNDPLFATCIFFIQNDTKVCLITADLIGFAKIFTRDVQQRIAATTAIDPRHILLCASHTHRGPDVLWPMPQKNNLDYIENLKQNLVKLAINAEKNAVPATISTTVTKADMGCNRRLLVDGKIEFAPNPDGVYDNDVMIVTIESNNKLQGIITSHGCHPTAAKDGFISADYPGWVRELLLQNYEPSTTISFLAGCCGNIRPHDGSITNDRQWSSLRDEQITDYANAVIKVVNGDMCVEDSASMCFIYDTLELSLDPERVSLSEFEVWLAENEKFMAQAGVTEDAPHGGHNFIRKKQALENSIRLKQAGVKELTITFDVAILKIGRLIFTFLPGEEFAEIGLQIKALIPQYKVIPVTFYNAICPYIPTAMACREGGFEPNAFPWCGSEYPFPFAESCENIIINKISALFEQLEIKNNE